MEPLMVHFLLELLQKLASSEQMLKDMAVIHCEAVRVLAEYAVDFLKRSKDKNGLTDSLMSSLSMLWQDWCT